MVPFLVVILFCGGPAYGAKISKVQQKGATGYSVSGQGGGVQQRRQENSVRQSPHQAEIIQKAPGERIPLVPLEDGTVKTGTTSAKSQSLETAWQEFSRRNYQSAMDIFASLSLHPATKWEAKYGLAICSVKLKNPVKATQLLQEVAASKPYLKDTLPNLVALLIEQGQFDQARSYAVRIRGSQKSVWLAKVDEGVFRRRMHSAKQAKNAETYKTLVHDYQRELKQCLWPETFHELAGLLVESGDTGDGAELYRSLLSCPQKPDFRLGVYYSLKGLISSPELLALLEAEKTPSAASPGYLNKLHALKLELLHSLLLAESANAGDIAEKILKINPSDPVALSKLAWWHFNNKRYDDALTRFAMLHKNEPDNADHAIGLIYCMINLKRFDEALELAGRYKNSEKIVSLTREIKLAALWDKVTAASPDSSEIETLAKEILAINPGDENIKLVLGWWYFRNDNFEASYNEFKNLYDKKPEIKDNSYGLAISLEKLERVDEAIAVAEKHKGEDDRSAPLLAGMYLDKAKVAYKEKKYPEAQDYAEKSLAGNPTDATTRELLDLYKYKQTPFSRAMSMIEGLSGSSYGSVVQDLVGSTGLAVSASIQQGIDWFKLPGDITVSTYGEYKYSTRTSEKRYFDASGYGVGVEFKKSDFKLGAEYFWDTFTQQDQTKVTELLYFSWFRDWTKRIWSDDEEGSWLKMDALSGSTYGKATHDFAGLTGTSISGYINEGIDWFTLPGAVIFNTYAEYRASFRTKDSRYYNAHGPAVGFEFQKKPFTLGTNCFWQMYPERGIVDRQVGVYLRWYYDWDLKPNRDR